MAYNGYRRVSVTDQESGSLFPPRVMAMLRQQISNAVDPATSPSRIDQIVETLLNGVDSYAKVRIAAMIESGVFIVPIYGNVARRYPGTNRLVALHQTVLWISTAAPTERQPHDIWFEQGGTTPTPAQPKDVQYVAGSARFNRGSGSSVTSATITPPTVQAGDLIILTAAVLQSGKVFTVSGDLPYTKLGQTGRTGIESGIWYRVASAADAGQPITVTIDGTTGYPMSLALAVFRPTVPVAGAQATSQGSGSNSINVVPFTPSPDTRAIQIVWIARGTGAAAVLTPPAGVTAVASELPTSTAAPRTGVAFGLGAAPGSAVGNVWTNTSDHYAATWLLTLDVRA